MNNIGEIIIGEGQFWQKKPSDSLSSIEILAWWAASDLAALVDLIYTSEEFWAIAPETYLLLSGIYSYHMTLDELPSQSVAMVLLKADRVSCGMSACGDETKAPPKLRK